jgi:hypothetical protein
MYVCLKLTLFYHGFIYYTWNDQNNTECKNNKDLMPSSSDEGDSVDVDESQDGESDEEPRR